MRANSRSGSPVGAKNRHNSRLPNQGDQRYSASLIKLLRKHGLAPDKNLGQHYLVDPEIIEKIVDACSNWASALEIGPGPAVLTTPLSERLSLKAIEVDPRMVRAATEAAPKAEIVQADALQQDWKVILESLPEPRGIVSNMPYNITGPLLGKTAEVASLISGAVLMMQAEVADRILAPAGHGDRGYLSIWLQSLFEIHHLVSVPPESFLPPPKVDSTVLVLIPKRDEIPNPELLKFIKAAFVMPRKTLANNLKSHKGAVEAIAEAGLSESVRPHQLTWEDWQSLFQILKK